MTVIGRSAAASLDVHLRTELWRRIEEHLAAGQTLATEGQFRYAIESAYRDVTGETPPAHVCEQLRLLVHSVIVDRPDMFLARGVQNAVQKAFAHGVAHLRWDLVRVQRHGSASVQRFLRRARIRAFLHEIQLDPDLIDVYTCVRDAVAVLVAAQGPGRGAPDTNQGVAVGSSRSTTLPPSPASPSITDDDARDIELILDAPVLAAIGDGLVRADEAQRRIREQEQIRLQFHARAMEKLPQTVSTYVDDGLLSADHATQFRALAGIDAALKADDVDQEEAARQRLEFIDEDQQQALETVLQKAVQSTVSHLQVFDSLQKIRGDYDGLLRTLIQHKELVLGGDEGDRTPLMSALMRSPGFLDLAADAMERKDPEMRLLSARLPPYNQISPRKLEAAPKLHIDESFVDDLRRLSVVEYSEKLQSKDRTERNRASGDLLSLICLLDQLIEPTPFRRKVRLLLANRMLQACGKEVEVIYQAASSVEVARSKADGLLKRKLERVLADASPQEESAVRRRSQALLMTMEQKLAAETDNDAKEILNPLGSLGASEAGEPEVAASGAITELSETEKRRGALIVQIEIRVAGRPQMTEGVILVSPEDSQRHVMAERDPESGELTPQKRKGRLRYVNRRADGSWQALTG